MTTRALVVSVAATLVIVAVIAALRGCVPQAVRPPEREAAVRAPEARRPGKARERKRRVERPRVAIVIDDFGNNRRNVEQLFEMGVPVTFSVLPGLPHSASIAQDAHAKGYEVILHLPLEPHRKDVRLEPGTINGRMPRDEVLAILDEEIASVPHITGVSNHMGSKATEDGPLMELIFGELKRRGLFFLDSLVTEHSVCAEAARDTGTRYAERNVFLDNIDDEEYIANQVALVKKRAFTQGTAIAIGHDRKETVKVLAAMLPELEREGVRFVTVSELAK